MRRETVLGVALRALGLAFALGPFLIAFAMNNWDIEQALLEKGEMAELQQRLGGLFQQQEGGAFEIGNLSYDNATGRLRLPVRLASPFQFSVDLTEFELTLWADAQSVTLTMEEDMMRLMPGESENVWLSGYGALTAQPTRIDGHLTLEKAGVTMTFFIQQEV